MTENNVSVEKIQQGIDYLEGEFMKPLVDIGNSIIETYQDLNKVLKSDAIDKLIAEQKTKLEQIQTDLKKICDKAKTSMDDSSSVIKQNQQNIDSVLENA